MKVIGRYNCKLTNSKHGLSSYTDLEWSQVYLQLDWSDYTKELKYSILFELPPYFLIQLDVCFQEFYFIRVTNWFDCIEFEFDPVLLVYLMITHESHEYLVSPEKLFPITYFKRVLLIASFFVRSSTLNNIRFYRK